METTRENARRDETEGARLDRQLLELLNETRVAIPGVQVLFGFLLTVPFQARFADLSLFQERVYFATLLLSAAATMFLVAPTAYHRMMFREGHRPRLVELATRQLLVGLACLALALNGAVLLVTDLLFRTPTVVVVSTVVLASFAWLWFGLGLVRRLRGEPAW